MWKQKAHFTAILILSYAITTFFGTAMGADKVYKWKWYTPYNLTLSPSMDKLPKIIEQKTDGRVKVTLYVGGEHPFKGPDMPQAIKTGSCQMVDVFPGYCVGIDPKMGAFDLPFFAENAEEANAIIENVLNHIQDKLYNDYGMVYLASYPFPGQSLYGNVLMENLDSLKGKKVRVYNKVTSNMITALGGSPVTIPSSEVYQALEKGVIDAALGGVTSAVKRKFFEIIPKATRTDAYGQSNTWTVVISRKALDKLPKDLQNKVLEAGKEYEKYARDLQNSLVEAAMVEAKDKYKADIITISPDLYREVRKKMKSGCWDKWAADTPGGKELLQKMEKFHDDWMKK